MKEGRVKVTFNHRCQTRSGTVLMAPKDEQRTYIILILPPALSRPEVVFCTTSNDGVGVKFCSAELYFAASGQRVSFQVPSD